MHEEAEIRSPASAGQTIIAVTRLGTLDHLPESNASGNQPEARPVFWSPDELRQLSTSLLLEPFRRAFCYELTENRKKTSGEMESFRRIRDCEPLFKLVTLTSYGLGLTCAIFRDVYHVLEYVPMGKGHFWVALKEMGRFNLMYRLPHPEKALRLYVNPDVKSWTIPAHVNDDAWKRKLEELAVLHHAKQLELVEATMPQKDETILEVLSEVNLMNTVPIGNQRPAKDGGHVPSGNQTRSPVGTKPGPQWEPPLIDPISQMYKGSPSFKLREEIALLKEALADIQSNDESRAMAGIKRILGDEVMEPTKRNPLGDGGKWRLRWRSDRGKTHRVMAAVVEQMASAKGVKKPGGYAHDLWKRFA